MITNLRKFVDFLSKHQITADQFLLCFMLQEARFEIERGIRAGDDRFHGLTELYKYANACGKKDPHNKMRVVAWTYSDINNLINKEFIVNNNDPGEYHPDYFEVTDKFIHAIFSEEKDFDEFWDEYPDFVENFNDRRDGMIPLKAVLKEDIEELYFSRIKSKDNHRTLMIVLKWAKQNKLIKTNIRNFLGGEIYKGLLKKMKELGGATSSENIRIIS